jgi:SPFH domain / Band 7 family
MYAGKTSLTKIHSELPGFSINGWLMLLVALGFLISGLYCFRTALNPVGIYPDWVSPGSMGTAAAFLFALGAVIWRGLTIIQPNESILILLFGAYHGTIRRSGFRWCNPFARRVKLALRARNLVSDQLKVNDNHGNPIEIAVVVVWRIADTAQALFDVEMALNELQGRGVIDFDPERRAAMISNLLVVLCGESEPKPIINTGTLYH